MRIAELKRAAEAALALLAAEPGIREAEVFAAANRSLVTRLNYTSHIPCNGVEEPKSTEMSGLGLQVVFESESDAGPLIGFGSEPSDFGEAGVRRALDKARRSAVGDPEFRSLPRPNGEARVLSDYHDPRLFAIDDEQLVEAGWKVIAGGLGAFTASSRLAELAGTEAELRRIGLILGGDVTIRQESVAIASSHMPRAQTDESAYMTSSATAMVEAHEAKGSGWTTCTRLDDFTDEAGSEAAANAIAAIGGRRVPTGDYTVIFGRQPVADLLNNLVLPACHAGAFYASSTPFLGRLGRAVAVPELGIYDHGALPGLIGSKGITCEGLPTGRTDLIKDGVLVGLLSHWYDSQRLLHDPRVADKLGVDGPSAARALVPRNGFRYDGGGRSFERRPSTSACNVVIEGSRPRHLRGADPRGQGRPLYRAHLVHLPDQWPPRGRLHVHGGRRLLRHPRRTHHRADPRQYHPHQRQYHPAAPERRRHHEGRQGHEGVGGRRGRVRAGARGERGARRRDRRLHGERIGDDDVRRGLAT